MKVKVQVKPLSAICLMVRTTHEFDGRDKVFITAQSQAFDRFVTRNTDDYKRMLQAFADTPKSQVVEFLSECLEDSADTSTDGDYLFFSHVLKSLKEHHDCLCEMRITNVEIINERSIGVSFHEPHCPCCQKNENQI